MVEAASLNKETIIYVQKFSCNFDLFCPNFYCVVVIVMHDFISINPSTTSFGFWIEAGLIRNLFGDYSDNLRLKII